MKIELKTCPRTGLTCICAERCCDPRRKDKEDMDEAKKALIKELKEFGC